MTCGWWPAGLTGVALAALLIAPATPAPAESPPREDRRDRLSRALSLLREALNELAALEQRGDEEAQLASAYFQLGISQLAAGRRAAAREAFREAAHLRPERHVDPSIYAPELLKLYAEAKADIATSARGRADAAAPMRTGSLAVTSDVWVNVSVDGQPSDETPVFIPRLAAGRHRLEASRAGFRPETLEVEVEEGETRRVHLRLQPEGRRP
jgi:tetratricopeptide (TPR) repeat protein